MANLLRVVNIPLGQEMRRKDLTPKYSICITHRNNRETLQESLESILGQVDERFQIIVVDGKSTDGSLEILREYERAGKILLFEAKSSRGTGRQLAFDYSTGEIVIANVDFDEIYPPNLMELLIPLTPYANKAILMVNDREVRSGSHGFTLATRDMINSLGGWHDLNYYEDYELWRRAASQKKFAWVALPVKILRCPHPERKTFVGHFKHRYTGYVNKLQVGLRVFGEDEKRTLGQLATYWVARLAAIFKRSYRDPKMQEFNPLSNEYRLEVKTASS